jgi:hypothetical protein
VNVWADLESSLHPVPRFHVGKPDGRRDWSEADRQATLFRVMRMAAPTVHGFPVPNAGKRNPMKARKEGIVAGVFDTQWRREFGQTADIELKGYDARGRAGTLSAQQIEWGNRQLDLGFPVACFFCPYEAADWLRLIGFPVREIARAG